MDGKTPVTRFKWGAIVTVATSGALVGMLAGMALQEKKGEKLTQSLDSNATVEPRETLANAVAQKMSGVKKQVDGELINASEMARMWFSPANQAALASGMMVGYDSFSEGDLALVDSICKQWPPLGVILASNGYTAHLPEPTQAESIQVRSVSEILADFPGKVSLGELLDMIEDFQMLEKDRSRVIEAAIEKLFESHSWESALKQYRDLDRFKWKEAVAPALLAQMAVVDPLRTMSALELVPYWKLDVGEGVFDGALRAAFQSGGEDAFLLLSRSGLRGQGGFEIFMRAAGTYAESGDVDLAMAATRFVASEFGFSPNSIGLVPPQLMEELARIDPRRAMELAAEFGEESLIAYRALAQQALPEAAKHYWENGKGHMGALAIGEAVTIANLDESMQIVSGLGGWKESFVKAYIVKNIAADNYELALKTAMSLPEDGGGALAMKFLTPTMVDRGPEVALEWIFNTPDVPGGQEALIGSVIAVWSESDPIGAAEWLLNAQVSEDVRTHAISRFAQETARSHPQLAYNLVETVKDSDSKAAVLEHVGRYNSRFRPEATPFWDLIDGVSGN
ncbi:hypothetical protein BH23VER1_BH23VER1_14960 [soil metagenome]